MTLLNELLAQQAELEKKIIDIRHEERLNSINKIKIMMVEFGLEIADISGRLQTHKTGRAVNPSGKVAPKYRNSTTGDQWSGRGIRPKWLQAAVAAGASMDDFRI